MTQPRELRALVLENRPIAEATWRMRVAQPEIGAALLPGQFVMLRAAGRTDPLLGRAFALYDVARTSDGSVVGFDVVYLVQGNGTRCLSTLAEGAAVDLWGPLGNTFPQQAPGLVGGHLLLVAGGVGQTPFLALIREYLGQETYGNRKNLEGPPRRISFAYGARTSRLLAGVSDFTSTGADVHLATNDGSQGHRGYVTELVEMLCQESDPPTMIFGCGPEPMLARLAATAKSYLIPCWVSLESRMACGYGVCFSCVCPIFLQPVPPHQESPRMRTEFPEQSPPPESWDYRRVCTEGPIFPAHFIAWNAHPAHGHL